MAVPEQQEIGVLRGDRYAIVLVFDDDDDLTGLSWHSQVRRTEDNPEVIAEFDVMREGQMVVCSLTAAQTRVLPQKFVMDVEERALNTDPVTIFRAKGRLTKDVTRPDPEPVIDPDDPELEP